MSKDTDSTPSRRRLARKLIFRVLFATDKGEISPDEDLRKVKASFEDELGMEIGQSDQEFARVILEGLSTKKIELDEAIEKHSHHWKLSRMNSVDRNLLRLAAYEILYCPDIPPAVTMNEVLELAKVFGDSDSPSFLNGILDSIEKQP